MFFIGDLIALDNWLFGQLSQPLEILQIPKTNGLELEFYVVMITLLFSFKGFACYGVHKKLHNLIVFDTHPSFMHHGGNLENNFH